MLRTRFGHRYQPTPEDIAAIAAGAPYRASGECPCPVCGQPYWKHCSVAPPHDYLTRICTGDFVKL